MPRIVHIFGGPNGVGKSTLGNIFSESNSIIFINPDQIYIDQKSLHSNGLTQVEFNGVLDVYIENALTEDDVVIIENNLHEESAYKFVLSYINKFEAVSICRFYYLDDVNVLIERVKNRVLHLGHVVDEETVKKRYKTSIEMIVEKIKVFNEIHFYDVTGNVPVKVFEVFDGSINYVNEEIEFEWSNKLIELLLPSNDSED